MKPTNFDALNAVTTHIKDSRYKPKHVILLYKDVPEEFKKDEYDFHSDEAVICFLGDNGEYDIKKYMES